MKVILSRKGFDSQYGGNPSIILPNGMLLSFPIPTDTEENAPFYKDIPLPEDIIKYLNHDRDRGYKNYQDIFEDLKISPVIHNDDRYIYAPHAHHDPDMENGCLGQSGAAVSHLNKANVDEGDVFLFFGRFRMTKFKNKKLVFTGKSAHVIWGFLKIKKKCLLENNEDKNSLISESSNYKYLEKHPHLIRDITTLNALYIADRENKNNDPLGTYGVFTLEPANIQDGFVFNSECEKNRNDKLVLTNFELDKKDGGVSKWKLGLFKNIREFCDISYHSNDSFEPNFFKSATKGQEFVISLKKDKQNEKYETKLKEWFEEILQAGLNL